MEKYKSEIELPEFVDDNEPLRSVPFGAGCRADVKTLFMAVSSDLEDNHGPVESSGINVPASRLLAHAEEYRKKGDLELAEYFTSLAGA
jgi:hypothetical protein